MRFTLKENAIDSLNRSFLYFSEGTLSGLKAAVKEAISSIELFLKEKIRTLDVDPESPCLVYDKLIIKVDHLSKKYLVEPLSTKTTVTLSQALERLNWLGNPIAETDKQSIFGLKKIRNTLEHYDIDISAADVRSSYISSIGFHIKFLHKYLNLDFHKVVNQNLWENLVINNEDIKALTESTSKDIFENIINSTIKVAGLTTCIKCGCDVMVEERGGYYSGFKCKVCGYNHWTEMCYRCKEDFFIDELEPCEGDTMLCKKCYSEYVG